MCGCGAVLRIYTSCNTRMMPVLIRGVSQTIVQVRHNGWSSCYLRFTHYIASLALYALWSAIIPCLRLFSIENGRRNMFFISCHSFAAL